MLVENIWVGCIFKKYNDEENYLKSIYLGIKRRLWNISGWNEKEDRKPSNEISHTSGRRC